MCYQIQVLNVYIAPSEAIYRVNVYIEKNNFSSSVQSKFS